MNPTPPPDSQNSNAVMKDFLKAFLLPTIVNKSFMYYFGLKYSENPGEGYGYGLVATICVTAILIGSFIWKYRHNDDP